MKPWIYEFLVKNSSNFLLTCCYEKEIKSLSIYWLFFNLYFLLIYIIFIKKFLNNFKSNKLLSDQNSLLTKKLYNKIIIKVKNKYKNFAFTNINKKELMNILLKLLFLTQKEFSS